MSTDTYSPPVPLSAAGLRLAVVVSRFNGFVTDRLREGALDAIAKTGGTLAEGDVIQIPGAWEFPVTVRALAHRASAASGVPMAFGILTTNTVEQATDRAGGKHGNKGYDAAMTAIEMALLLRAIKPQRFKPRRRRART